MAMGVVLSRTGPRFWYAVVCAVGLEYRSRVRRPSPAVSLACNDGGVKHGLSSGSGAGVKCGGIRQCGASVSVVRQRRCGVPDSWMTTIIVVRYTYLGKK
jgi:hypothetical protein